MIAPNKSVHPTRITPLVLRFGFSFYHVTGITSPSFSGVARPVQFSTSPPRRCGPGYDSAHIQMRIAKLPAIPDLAVSNVW
jgi:hypothetical protein